MSAHTPAPWWVTDNGIRDRGGYIVHTNSVQRYGDQHERYAFEVAQREADKRLIAAAPDLLEALQRAVACGMVPITSAQEGGAATHSEQVRTADAIRAAIAKATGEQP